MGSPGKADTRRGASPRREAETPQALARGAGWFADPYGSATEQRWYDGRKWTQQVRPGGSEDASPGPHLRPRPARRAEPGGPGAPAAKPQPAPAAAPAASPQPAPAAAPAAKPPARRSEPAKPQPEPAEFPVKVSDAVGKRLWLVDSGSRRRFSYHLLSDSGRVASLRLFDRSRLATLEAADGAWWLTNRSRTAWELLIRAAGGEEIGSYSGRRWRAGGAIGLSSGHEAELARTLTGTWKVRSGESRQILASIRPSGRPGETRTAVTLHWLPDGSLEAGLVILIACAVVTLEQAVPGVPAVAASHSGGSHQARTGTDRRPG